MDVLTGSVRVIRTPGPVDPKALRIPLLEVLNLHDCLPL